MDRNDKIMKVLPQLRSLIPHGTEETFPLFAAQERRKLRILNRGKYKGGFMMLYTFKRY